MERRRGGRSRTQLARRGARALALRLAEPRYRALPRALLAALLLRQPGLPRLGGAQAQRQFRQALDRGRPVGGGDVPLPARARLRGGELRAGLPLGPAVEHHAQAPVLDQRGRRLEDSLRGSGVNFRGLFMLSAAAVVPAGALAADPQVDVRTSAGTIRLELYPAKAPKTVENFLQYVRAGHYNGTVFHRVIPGFMVQGGGFDKAFQQKKTRGPIANEAQGAVKGGLKNDTGTIAM